MAGQPPSCLLFGGRTMHLSELLLKEEKGDFSPRTAGRQCASHTLTHTLSLSVHAQTHTLQLTGTGHGLNIYQAHANKGTVKKITINLCLNYVTT